MILINFIIRLVSYAVLLGVSSRVFQTLWEHFGLDSVGALHSFHDKGVTGLLVAPIVLALVGAGRLREIAVFFAFFLAGAALTAPYVCARIAGL